jgi:hypothetical protein
MNSRTLDFPANPSTGDKHKGWKWDGEKWVATASASGGIDEAPEDSTLYGRKDGDWEAIPTSNGGGGDDDCACLNPTIWDDQLGLDLKLMASDYVSSNFPIHPLIQWTGGYLQIGVWRIGEGPLGFQMIYSDQPDGMAFTEAGVIRTTGNITSASVNVIPAGLTRGNTFNAGKWLISNIGDPLYFYYDGVCELILQKNGDLEILGNTTAYRNSVVRAADWRSIDHDFGNWYMTTENDDLQFVNNNGPMASLIGGGSVAAAGTVKTGEEFI